MVLAAIAFIFFGLGFGIRTGAAPWQCIYGSGECSVAAATWTLVLVTIMAFLAAYQAAVSALDALSLSRRTYELETEPLLGQSFCDDGDHTLPRQTVYIENQNVQLLHPTAHGFDEFSHIDFDFQNLGRSALRDVSVEAALRFTDINKPVSLKIGNIAANAGAHIRFSLLLNAVSLPTIEWSPLAQTKQGELDFSPLDPIKVEVVVEKGSGKRSWSLSFVEKRSSDEEKR